MALSAVLNGYILGKQVGSLPSFFNKKKIKKTQFNSNNKVNKRSWRLILGNNT